MNLLDENIWDEQRLLLLARHISVRQIGLDMGRKGMKDDEIIALLHSLRDTAFFTHDRDFDEQAFCHPRYCLVFLAVKQADIAEFVRRVLLHSALNTKAKRMGLVVHVSYEGMRIWRRKVANASYVYW